MFCFYFIFMLWIPLCFNEYLYIFNVKQFSELHCFKSVISINITLTLTATPSFSLSAKTLSYVLFDSVLQTDKYSDQLESGSVIQTTELK